MKSNSDARTIDKVIINIMTKHAYLLSTPISDIGSAFVSHVIKEVPVVLGVTLKHAPTKPAQTIGMLERPHASIKQALKVETGVRRSLWQKYVSNAVLNYNTSYQASIGCEPSRVFHEGIPNNDLDLNLGIHLQQAPILTLQIAQDVLEQTNIMYQNVRKNAMQAYIKYEIYYDRKANASKFKPADYVYVFQTKVAYQGRTIPFMKIRWILPYNTEKVLTNNNYAIRKIGTNKMQVFHRMRLRQLTHRQLSPDLHITPHDWKVHPDVSNKHDDLYARAWESENESSIFDTDYDNGVICNWPENAVRPNLPAEQKLSTPGTTRDVPQKFITKRISYLT